MSNFLAVAAATATLQRELQAAVQADVPGARVTTVRPAEGSGSQLPTTGVNLYLFSVSHNPHWRNTDLPTRQPTDGLVERPQAALDLHYLCSFYGNEVELEPQRLLGSTVAHLHSRPILTRAAITATVSDPAFGFLADSDLAEQVDLVRFVPLPLSLEELSRLWSVLFQVRYVLSVAYRASVVLVSPDETPSPALPARALALRAVTLRPPVVTAIVPQAGADQPILAGSPLHVRGRDLAAEVVLVDLDGVPLPVDEVRDDRLAVTLPATVTAGAHRLGVRHGVDVGSPGSPAPRPAVAATGTALIVHPRIAVTAEGDPDLTVSDVTGSGTEPRSATITVGVEPAVAAGQVVTLELLGPAGVTSTTLAPAVTGPASQVAFRVVDVAAGSHVARIRVDGAESPIDVDDAGVPTAPALEVP